MYKDCKYIKYYDSYDLITLKEETDNKFINKGQLLYGAKCSKCLQLLVKSNKTDLYDSNINAVFNTRRSIMGCNEFLTCGPGICYFFIYYDWKVTLIVNDSSNKEDGTPRHVSRRRR